MDISTVVGSAGVALLLVAFFLNLVKRLPQDSVLFAGMNAVGAGLSCYTSGLIGFIPFVVLEGTWSLVVIAALARVIRR